MVKTPPIRPTEPHVALKKKISHWFPVLNNECNFSMLAGFLLKNEEKSVHSDNGGNSGTAPTNPYYITEQCLVSNLIILAVSMEFLQIYADQLVFPYKLP